MKIEVKGEIIPIEVLTKDCVSTYPSNDILECDSNIMFSIYEDDASPIADIQAFSEPGKAEITIKGMVLHKSASIDYQRELLSSVCSRIFDEELMKCPILVIHVVCTKESGIPSKVAEQLGFVGQMLHNSPYQILLNPNYTLIVHKYKKEDGANDKLRFFKDTYESRVFEVKSALIAELNSARTLGETASVEMYEMTLGNLDPDRKKRK